MPTFIIIWLATHYDGTHVELLHRGFERLGRDAAEQFPGYESGWDVHHLAELKSIVESD